MHPWICRTPVFINPNCPLKSPILTPISNHLAKNPRFPPKSPQNADSLLKFLEKTGFSNTHIEAIAQKAPRLLSANLETSIMPKIKAFQDLGFEPTDTADIISAYPLLLGRSPDRIRLSILGLKSIFGPNFNICKLLKNTRGGRFLVHDLHKTLVPNIEYLKSFGISPEQIATYACRFPVNFLSKPEKFRGYVRKVEEMGVDRKSKTFLCAVSVISSMTRENWEVKLKLFQELGFSENDIVFAFRRSPKAFTKSEKKIRDVIELLLSVVELSYIVKNPQLFCYSIEKRYKPRLRVLEAIESRNLLMKRPAFTTFFQITDEIFMKKFVIPYCNEVEDLLDVFKGSEAIDSEVQIDIF